ncbi:protein of unknown function [Candidatus Nitrosotalea okcheonensis]|uniref:Uncharacterized protein n=1 Tax=Candidatus Nitrosotalea okcheonensis TaxID=1903276 RepID=A0A2H1FCI6_9ARCH|nr:protein of unknown function [Candidatus Nitrosotalea okcheonensis]
MLRMYTIHVIADSSKKHGLRILKGVKIVLKSIVLDFEEPKSSKNHN